MNNYRGSPPVTGKMAAFIKYLLKKGWYQHDIAALLGINQGRISEVNSGAIHPGIEPSSDWP